MKWTFHERPPRFQPRLIRINVHTVRDVILAVDGEGGAMKALIVCGNAEGQTRKIASFFSLVGCFNARYRIDRINRHD